jgi:hypothetical protein
LESRYAVAAEVTIGLASYMQLSAQSLVVPFTFISFKDFYYKAPEGYRFSGIFGRARVFSQDRFTGDTSTTRFMKQNSWSHIYFKSIY